jgi:chromosome segregation ATPase
MSNATMERPANLTIETEITRALREQLTEHPRESERLVQRLAQLRAERDPAHQAVIELRIKVRARLAKASELDRALAALDQIDGEIRSLENESEDYESAKRVIGMELAEQLARRRATVAPQLTAEAKRAIAAISEGLAALQPHVDTLLALRPAVAQFDRNVPHPHGYTVYHRELNPAVVQAVNFFGKDYHGGCELPALRERWQTIADALK